MNGFLIPLLVFPLTAVFAKTVIPYKVERGKIIEKTLLFGSVEPLHSETIEVKWRSLIRKMPVRLGQEVKKGDLIAEVELKYFESRNEYLKGRQEFAKAHLDQTKIDETYVKKEQKRMRELAAEEIVARNKPEEIELKVLEAKMRRSQAETELKNIQKQLSETENKIKKANYYAPGDGVITELVVDPKQLVGSFSVRGGAVLARVDKPGKYIVRAIATDSQVANLVPDQKATIILEGKDQVIRGKVHAITISDAMSKEKMNLFEVQIHFDQKGPILNRGISARAEIVLNEVEDVPVIPWNALIQTDDKDHVKILDSEKGWIRRNIKIGARGQHQLQVLSGLSAGDIIAATLW